MNAPSIDIMEVLRATGCGTPAVSLGWALFVGREPPTPDTSITLYDCGGRPPDPAWLHDEPSIQVRIRGVSKDYSTAYNKALEVRDALHGFADKVINGTRYVGIAATSDIGFLMYDGSNRPIFTFNIRIIREPSSGIYRS